MRIVGVPPSGGLQPYAPTSVTATAGDGQATISFTAPTWFGKNLVASSYTATSSPGGITGSGVTSGFNVTGLTNGTAYTFTVQTNTSYGVSSVASAASNSVTPVTPSSFESIATATGTGSSGTITFSSIPSTYSSLQIRIYGRTVASSDNMAIRLNGDTGTNYTWHELRGDGINVAVNGLTGQTYGRCGYAINDTSNGGVSIIDIIDYSSSTKNKTIRSFAGDDTNGGATNSIIRLTSNLWLSTSAVTSLSIITTGGNSFATNATFALYGIRG
jgi:hypothetical protein